MKTVWSMQALDDLRRISHYIRQYRPGSARKVGQQIRRVTRRLSRFPLSGRVLPELPDYPYREVMSGDYRIVYEVQDDQVLILTVVHGAMDLPTLLQTPDD